MSTVSSETFGQRVRRLREGQKVRQVDLAVRAGISWRHLIRIEQDSGGVTKPATVARLAIALGVAPAELTGSDEEEESDPVRSLDDLLRLRVRRLIEEELSAIA